MIFSHVVDNTLSSRDFRQSCNQLVNVLLCNVDVSSNNNTFLGALFNVDSHLVKYFRNLMSCETFDLYDCFGRILLEIIKISNVNLGQVS
jgi:hypothetical protein